MTFSLVARCSRTGQLGVAAATAMPAVGKLVSYGAPGTGAIATQAQLNPYHGIDGMALLRAGASAPEVLDRLKREDPRLEVRQFAVADSGGRVAAWTGSACPEWAGHRLLANLTVQGNRLAGPEVLDAMAEAFERDPELSLAERMVDAVVAGVERGGDTKGERSATLYIFDTEEYPLWDIRVDDHERPSEELRRLYAIFARELVPLIRTMPTRANPAGDEEESAV